MATNAPRMVFIVVPLLTRLPQHAQPSAVQTYDGLGSRADVAPAGDVGQFRQFVSDSLRLYRVWCGGKRTYATATFATLSSVPATGGGFALPATGVCSPR